MTHACMVISIHAPTNGATLSFFMYGLYTSFQSTLRRTERLAVLSEYLQNTNFNPRSDERSDAVRAECWAGLVVISIHAPTNGATLRCVQPFNSVAFQSTLRRTERRLRCVQPFNSVAFQSTLRRTERRDIS